MLSISYHSAASGPYLHWERGDWFIVLSPDTTIKHAKVGARGKWGTDIEAIA